MFKTGIQLYPSVKIYRFDDFFGEVLKVQLEIDKKKNLLTDSFAVDRYRYGLCADGTWQQRPAQLSGLKFNKNDSLSVLIDVT